MCTDECMLLLDVKGKMILKINVFISKVIANTIKACISNTMSLSINANQHYKWRFLNDSREVLYYYEQCLSTIYITVKWRILIIIPIFIVINNVLYSFFTLLAPYTIRQVLLKISINTKPKNRKTVSNMLRYCLLAYTFSKGLKKEISCCHSALASR
jgi:hypothetical protein